jgi:FMN reductase (NADPH)
MLDTILNHKSIRKYKSDPIDKTILDQILLAGTRASTTGNMQVYSIIVTTDLQLKQRLWDIHFKQEMVMQAPVILTFCADFNRFTKWCDYRKAKPFYDNFLSFITAAIDAMLAAQNVALAAENFQLGICYLGTTLYNADKIIKLLKCPKLTVPVTTLVLGYPDEKPDLTDRLPLSGVIHTETYHDYSYEDIDLIYKDKETLQQTAELLKINSKETLAQIFTDNRYTKKDNIKYSQRFLRVLDDQGFTDNE